MRKPFNRRLFFILLAAAVFGSIALIPYSLALSGGAALTWQLFALALLQSLVMYGLAIGLGLVLANAIGLGLPIVEAALRREPTGAAIRGMLPISILLGIAAGVLIVVLDRFAFQPAMAAQLGEQATALTNAADRPGPLKAFLASFYGGINEEILLRLFVMSLFAWLGRFASRTANGRPTTAVLWIANILAAVLFGLGHLPATSMFVPLTPLVIARAVVLNSLVGIPCGYLYMKRGLESAVVAHFSTDIVLHVIFGI